MIHSRRVNNQKKSRIIPILIFSMVSVGIFLIAVPQAAFAYVIPLEVGIGTLKNITDPYLATYMNAIYKFIIGMVAIAAVAMISFGGLQWALAAGNQEQVTAAKKRIVDALFGLVLALMSYNILNLLNPEIITMKDIEVPNIDYSQLGAAMEIKCEWLDATEAAGTDYISSRDEFCEDEGDKPATASGCYCDLRSNIVSMAQALASDYNSITYGCCWGFCDVVYNESGAAFHGGNPYTSAVLKTNIGDINGNDPGCTPGDNSVANTSACTDGAFNYATLTPGDWLYIFNGHSAGLGADGVYNAGDSGNGLHSVIFIGWSDEVNHVGICAGGGVTSAGAQYAKVNSIDFDDIPIVRQFLPKPTTEYRQDAGRCG